MEEVFVPVIYRVYKSENTVLNKIEVEYVGENEGFYNDALEELDALLGEYEETIIRTQDGQTAYYMGKIEKFFIRY